jgi:hypothetical protein
MQLKYILLLIITYCHNPLVAVENTKSINWGVVVYGLIFRDPETAKKPVHTGFDTTSQPDVPISVHTFWYQTKNLTELQNKLKELGMPNPYTTEEIYSPNPSSFIDRLCILKPYRSPDIPQNAQKTQLVAFIAAAKETHPYEYRKVKASELLSTLTPSPTFESQLRNLEEMFTHKTGG